MEDQVGSSGKGRHQFHITSFVITHSRNCNVQGLEELMVTNSYLNPQLFAWRAQIDVIGRFGRIPVNKHLNMYVA